MTTRNRNPTIDRSDFFKTDPHLKQRDAIPFVWQFILHASRYGSLFDCEHNYEYDYDHEHEDDYGSDVLKKLPVRSVNSVMGVGSEAS